MAIPTELRNDVWAIYLLVRERVMPSNNTAERLVERSGLSADRVLGALDVLWHDDAGWIRVATSPSGERGFYCDTVKNRSHKPVEIDLLYQDWEADQDDDEEDWDEDEDEDDEDLPERED